MGIRWGADLWHVESGSAELPFDIPPWAMTLRAFWPLGARAQWRVICAALAACVLGMGLGALLGLECLMAHVPLGVIVCVVWALSLTLARWGATRWRMRHEGHPMVERMVEGAWRAVDGAQTAWACGLVLGLLAQSGTGARTGAAEGLQALYVLTALASTGRATWVLMLHFYARRDAERLLCDDSDLPVLAARCLQGGPAFAATWSTLAQQGPAWAMRVLRSVPDDVRRHLQPADMTPLLVHEDAAMRAQGIAAIDLIASAPTCV